MSTHSRSLASSPAPAIDPSRSTDIFYETNARQYFDRTVSLDLSPLYDRVLKLVRPGGRILDAGCGSGRDLKVFRSRGFDAVGIDASTALVSLANDFSGALCLPVRLEDVDFDGCFDAVWACASLLHIPKHKIPQVLNRLNKALVLGGAIFASVQIGEGETLTPDGRFFAYYAPEEFAQLLNASGFSIDDVWISEDSLPDRTALRWSNVIARR
jgi:SAM-dependent methyltransferase